MRSQAGLMAQSGGGGGGTVTSVVILDAGNDHTITLDTATDEAANRTLTIPALGGNKTIALVDLAQTFTASNVFESSAAAPTKFRKPSGLTDGSEEVQIYDDGAYGYIAANGHPVKLVRGATTYYVFEGVGFSFTSAGTVQWQVNTSTVILNNSHQIIFSNNAEAGGTKDVGIARGGVGVLRITDSSTGGGVIEFGQVADVPTPASNSANIGAEDVAGTAEIICADEGGTETQQTEHRSDGPAWLYDDVAVTGMLDRIEYDRQRYLGTHRYKNISRRDRKQSGLNETTKRVLLAIVDQLGIVLPAEDMAVLQEPSLEQTCEHTETLTEYGIRCPEKSVIQKRDWATDQAAKQARYDADRQAEMDRVAKLQADHAKELSDYAKLPAAEKAKKPAPTAPELPAVRPAKNIKKPKPSWIK